MLRLLSHAILIALTCALAMCAMLVAFRSAPANDKNELKAQAEALLAKSQGLSNIEAPGSPPFVLNMKIHYQIGAQSMDGQGQIIWLAPDHYREAYAAPNYSYTGIVRDGYHYLARTKNETPLAIYELQRTLERALGASVIKNARIKQADASQFGGQSLTCVTFSDKSTLKRCFTSDGDVATMELDPPPLMGVLGERYEFSNFVEFGLRRFPQKLIFHGGDGHVIEIDVQQLATTKEVVADAFAAPLGSMKETWCAEPEMAAPQFPTGAFSYAMNPGPMIDADRAFRYVRASLYIEIGPSGHARRVTVIRSTKPIDNTLLRIWTDNMRFSPRLCRNQGTEYQMEMSFAW